MGRPNSGDDLEDGNMRDFKGLSESEVDRGLGMRTALLVIDLVDGRAGTIK